MTENHSGEVLVGTRLAAAREARKWTVEEAAKRTKIKKDTLIKIENNQFDRLPSTAYARGFVRIYANELGLDAWALLKDFDGDVDEELDFSELHPADLEAIPKRKQPSRTNAQGLGIFLILAAFVGISAVVGVKLYQLYRVWGSVEKQILPGREQGDSKPVAGEDGQEIPVAKPVQETIKKAEPVAKEEAPSSVLSGGRTLRLHMDPNASENEQWVRVISFIGNKEVILFEDLIPAGATMPAPNHAPWTGESFVLKVKEANRVEIIFDGEKYKYPKGGIQTIPLNR